MAAPITTPNTKKERKLNWTNTLFFGLTTLGAFAATPVYLYFFGFSWWLLAIFFFQWAAMGMAVTGGYHRCLSHRAFKCHPVVKFLYLLFGAGAFQGSALEWATEHRTHHRHVDTENDPYNINEGFFYAHLGWILYQDPDYWEGHEFPKDLTEDRLVMWQHRNWLWLAMFMSFGFPMLLGWAVGLPLGGLVFGGILRQCVGSHATFMINSWAHTFGKRPYTETQTARDSLILAILAWGEGYHNYHHQFASDYRNGTRWYHWDPTKWSIGVLSWLGLTSHLKRIPASEILAARMRCEQKSMLQKGYPAEKLQMMQKQVEIAQKKVKEMYADYLEMKRNLKANSGARYQEMKHNLMQSSETKLLTLKADYKASKKEFKAAVAAWRIHIRAWRAVPALSSY